MLKGKIKLTYHHPPAYERCIDIRSSIPVGRVSKLIAIHSGKDY